MLSIDLDGARVLLDWLQRNQHAEAIDQQALDQVMKANSFFVDYYSGWEGCDRQTIRQAILHFNLPEQVPDGAVPGRLAEGFRWAVEQMDLFLERLVWLGEIDPSEIAGRVLDYLPDGTPLDSRIHITVDLFNGAFVHQDEMGVSVLHGAISQQKFEEAVSHELHHIGFRYWSERDPDQQKLLAEKNGRAIAVMHIANLLMEGMANFYCTPGAVFREKPDETPDDPYQRRLDRLRNQEEAFFAQAETLLDRCLQPEAAYETCWEAYKSIAFDMEEMMLPLGHYLGARMLKTMAQFHDQDRILSCVQHLSDFLPAYNQAASALKTYIFNKSLVKRFGGLFEGSN